MFEYTKNNYFRWGFQPEPFSGLPESPDRIKFWYDIGQNSPGLAIGPYRHEAMEAAKMIAERADKPITLFLSGGIDGEVMVHAFRDAEIEFDCTIISLAYGLNQQEVSRATAICDRWGITKRYIEIDPFRLWYNPPKWMEKYRMDSGLLYVFLEAIDRSWDRFQVFGGNPNIKVDWSDIRQPYFELRKSMLCHTLAWMDRGHPSVSFFHMYTPELMFHWLNSPLIEAWADQVEGSRIYDFDQIKTLFYRIEYKEIMFSRPKATGEEHLRVHIQDLWENQWKSYRPFNPVVRRSLEELRQELA